MKTSITLLKYKETKEKTIEEIMNTDADYIHVDIMDGKFVPPVVLPIDEVKTLFKDTIKPLDVHLMVENPLEYIESLYSLNIEYLSFHVEIKQDINTLISKVKSYGIKVGLAINPNTAVEALNPYLSLIDDVIVMGVNPGYGGQKLIPETINKVSVLKRLRSTNNYNYKISFDGGVNKDTRPLLNDVDILAIGSYVSMSDNFQEAINSIK